MIGRTFFFGGMIVMILSLTLYLVSHLTNSPDIKNFIGYPFLVWFIIIVFMIVIEVIFFLITGKNLNLEDRILRKLGFSVEEIEDNPPGF
jgi:hypothetical protein